MISRQTKIQKMEPMNRPETKITDLPEEVMTQIFKYIPHVELYGNVRPVCKYWSQLSCDSSLWREIDAGPEIPLHDLLKWLENAINLQSLHIRSRKDAGQVLKWVQKYNKNIKELKLYNCQGTEFRRNIPSNVLCNILIRCPYLKIIELKDCTFISCKFFRLLPSLKLMFEKRKRNIKRNLIPPSIEFFGTPNKKQIKTYLTARLKAGKKCSFQKICEDDNTEQDIIVYSEEEIERVINELRN